MDHNEFISKWKVTVDCFTANQVYYDSEITNNGNIQIHYEQELITYRR